MVQIDKTNVYVLMKTVEYWRIIVEHLKKNAIEIKLEKL